MLEAKFIETIHKSNRDVNKSMRQLGKIFPMLIRWKSVPRLGYFLHSSLNIIALKLYKNGSLPKNGERDFYEFLKLMNLHFMYFACSYYYFVDYVALVIKILKKMKTKSIRNNNID